MKAGSTQEPVTIGDLEMTLILKDVKNVHLSVHPPDGRITLVAPLGTRSDVARAYAISKLEWIRKQQQALNEQARQSARAFTERETHYLWGRRYLMTVQEADGRPKVEVDHSQIILTVRPETSVAKRAEVMHRWHKSLLYEAVPPLISKWEDILQVRVQRYFLQRMKTRWGSCNPERGHIRLNTELVKKPKEMLDYVVLHEMAHLLDQTHGQQFQSILNAHFPQWREVRQELNALPLSE
ncbi:M48 family metallopeptidase [Deinococcus radiophilus]|uniref:M48 family peptidase n=2 Tax=Deinococcus radiophilus TaxID=32062 RepID=A0A3S0I765_9DEIO|nr:SprT family zinc-dependent metalloprotease [Deinococcus radiophilus]RTR26364.1 M48 family peptidase [Deinococcus radiophilus]UFA51987.1 M48 family metallopeptidase [Deinococcus radiophilus]